MQSPTVHEDLRSQRSNVASEGAINGSLMSGSKSKTQRGHSFLGQAGISQTEKKFNKL